MDNILPDFLRKEEQHFPIDSGNSNVSLSFIDRTLKKIAGFIKTGYLQSLSASQKGLMQQLNAGVKIFFLLFFVVMISVKSSITGQLCLLFFLFILHLFSHIHMKGLYKRIFVLSFLFGFLVSAPASLNIFTPGEMLLPLMRFHSDHNFWIYSIPKDIGFTREGLIVVIRFFLKVFNSLSLTLLIIHTTSFNDLVKSFRILKVPDLLLMTITLTFKFLFVLAQTTEESYLAMKSRWWKAKDASESKKIIAGRISYIFRKSWIKYEEIYMAMVSRGYSGKTTIVYVQKVSGYDVFFITISIIVALFCYFV
jgi:cobalt/nickel transport system permease protein